MYTDLVNGITVTKNRENILANDISSISTEDLSKKLSAVSLKFEFENDTQVSRIVTKMNSQEMNKHNPKGDEISNKIRINQEKNGSRKNISGFQSMKRMPTKKKDSFITSDSSPNDDDSIIVYHRVLTERIKADAARLSPYCTRKKINFFGDDGIFTPFTNRKKIFESESDSSEKENNISNVTLKKFSKSKYVTKTEKNTIENVNKIKIQEKTKVLTSTNTEIVFSNLHEKNLSWSFSDQDLVSEKQKNKEEIREKTPNISLNKRKSLTSTPVTFNLNNLKKLTPKLDRSVSNTKLEESHSFLRSLSVVTGSYQLHEEAEMYKKKFKKLKEQLAAYLFRLFNREIFNDKLPCDLKIEWSARMRSSSGFCYNKRIKTVIGPDNECLRSSRIVLSSKIIETAERLRDTLIHEMCHAAAWIIDKKADGHGPCWKSWASKVQSIFPELPQIKRCHDYTINTKYKYRCVNCGYTIGRHSKSLNLEKKRCGFCFARFELLLNKKHVKSETIVVSPKNVTVRPLSKFALFVKENYGRVKMENANLKHGEIMKILSKNFADTKSCN